MTHRAAQKIFSQIFEDSKMAEEIERPCTFRLHRSMLCASAAQFRLSAVMHCSFALQFYGRQEYTLLPVFYFLLSVHNAFFVP